MEMKRLLLCSVYADWLLFIFSVFFIVLVIRLHTAPLSPSFRAPEGRRKWDVPNVGHRRASWCFRRRRLRG